MHLVKFLLFTFASIIISLSSVFAQKSINIGIADVESIVSAIDDAKKADTLLKETQKNYADSLKRMEDDFYKRIEVYKKQKGMMAADKQQKEEEDLQTMQQLILNSREDMSNKIMKKRDELLEPIRKKVKIAIEAVAKEEGINLVLDKSNASVLFSEDKFDITHRVIDKLIRNK
jgi:outer membrane protein